MCALAGAAELLPHGGRPGLKSQSSMWGTVTPWGCRVLKKSQPITQKAVKRATSKALANVMHSHGLSRRDLSDMLGCAPNTIINRLDADDSGSPLTIYELARGIREFGPEFGNAVLGDLTGHILTKANAEDICPSEIRLTTSRALTQLLELLEDNDLCDRDAVALAPVLLKLISKYQAIVAKAYAASGRAA